MKYKIQWGLALAAVILVFSSLLSWRANQQNTAGIYELEKQARVEQAQVFGESFKLKSQNYLNESQYIYQSLVELRHDGLSVASQLKTSSFVGLSELKKVNSKC